MQDTGRRTPNPPSSGDAPRDAALVPLLAEPRRRRLLETLERERSMRVGALVGEIAGDDPEASPSRSREVYLRVQHVDLPLLSGAGFLTYDHDSGEVSLAIPVARVGTLLDAVDERVA